MEASYNQIRIGIFKRLFSGVIWATIGKGVFLLCSLAVNALLTHLMTPSEVGAYYLIASITVIGSLVCLFGMQHSIVRFIAGGTGEDSYIGARRALRGAFLIFSSGATIVAIAYLLGFGRWISEYLFDSRLLGSVSLMTACWIVLRGLQIFVAQGLRGFHKLGIGSMIDGTSTTLFIMLTLFCLFYLNQFITLKIALGITNLALALSILIGGGFLWHSYKKSPMESGIELKGVLRVGLPLFVLSITIPGMAEAHIWILGGSLSEDQVAIYGVVNRLSRFVAISLLIVNEVIPSTIAQLWIANDRREIEKVLRTMATISSLPALFIVITFFLIGENLLSSLFGEYYKAGSTALIILVVSHAVNVLSGSPGVLLSMSDYQRVPMKIGIIAGTIGMLISLTTVKSYGYNGVAVGAGSSIIIHNCAMWLYCRKHLGITTHMRFDIIRSVHDFCTILKSVNKKKS